MATPLQSSENNALEHVHILIPKLPNEISMMVIRELDFVDLLAAYFTNLCWRKFIDEDETSCRKLFRLPPKLRNASNEEQAQHVAEQWQSIYDKQRIDDTERPKGTITVFSEDFDFRPDLDKIWHDVAFNPIFQPESPLTFSTF
ncbi:hypothetical protein FB567DRAFT_191163 [Paraphoma chrysanthemicola]|uniref:F-box domain-containing protein n=1 Tax=Paraphoma chrysanthemicola TaxID=798071 RepID=A0A8K0VT40_9PLEO|nr:hypothetical protein FB567DRAFT_191163 [Paraphoma chrysanthemicola]